MSQSNDSTPDPFFDVLTEALRAGPGSVQWGEAVAQLRDGGVQGGDEYRLLIRAREDLESGRDFRKVTAGPGFTRKVLDAVDREGARRNGVPTATIIGLVSAGVILAVVLALTVVLSRGGGAGSDAQQASLVQLEESSFPVAVTSASFASNAVGVPAGWRTVGGLPLDTKNGLQPAAPATSPAATQQSATFLGGGIITAEPIPSGFAFSVEVELALPPRGSGQVLTQVFVSDAPDFTPGVESGANEIAWVYRDGRVSVDVNEKGLESVALGAAGSTMKVSIRANDQTAVIETGGRRLYSGPHGLAADKPRYVGVRFLRAAGGAGAAAAVRSINVSQSAPDTAGGE